MYNVLEPILTFEQISWEYWIKQDDWEQLMLHDIFGKIPTFIKLLSTPEITFNSDNKMLFHALKFSVSIRLSFMKQEMNNLSKLGRKGQGESVMSNVNILENWHDHKPKHKQSLLPAYAPTKALNFLPLW